MKRVRRWLKQRQQAINLGDRVLRFALATRLVERQMHTLVLMTLTFLLRFVLSLTIRSLVTFNSMVWTSLFSVTLGVVFVLFSDLIYNMLTKYRNELAPLTHHICTHWDEAHLIRWKRNGLLILSALIMAYASVVTITSAKVIRWTLEAVTSAAIIDVLQQRRAIVARVQAYWYRPKVRRLVPTDTILLDASYRNDPTPPPPPPKKEETKVPLTLTQSLPPWSAVAKQPGPLVDRRSTLALAAAKQGCNVDQRARAPKVLRRKQKRPRFHIIEEYQPNMATTT